MAGVTALVPAGGRGIRLIGAGLEKPLVKVRSRPMIEYVIEALLRAERVERVVVLTSKHAPKTSEWVKGLPVEILETPGAGYIEDVKYAVKALRLGVVLIVAADLPLLTSELLDRVIKHYEEGKTPALSVMIPTRLSKALGVEPDLAMEIRGVSVSPAGVNVIDGRLIEESFIEQEELILEEPRLALNVNTLRDLRIAERLLRDLEDRTSATN